MGNVLNRIPFLPLALLALAWYGFDVYQFMTSSESALMMKQNELQITQGLVQTGQNKIREADAFSKTLDAKRVEIKNLNSQLFQTQTTLGESINVPAVMDTLINEAKKVNLRLLSINPGKESLKELFAEQPVEIEFRGVFYQLVFFLSKVSTLKEIMKVSNFSVQAVGTGDEKFVELRGRIQVLVYRYVKAELDKSLEDPKGSSAATMPRGQQPRANSGSTGGGEP